LPDADGNSRRQHEINRAERFAAEEALEETARPFSREQRRRLAPRAEHARVLMTTNAGLSFALTGSFVGIRPEAVLAERQLKSYLLPTSVLAGERMSALPLRSPAARI